MKKLLKITALIILVGAIALMFTACSPNDKEYFKRVGNYSFWDNKASQSIAQYKFYDIMDKHLSTDTAIKDGKAIGADGKTKKVLFLGWDGTRADALTNIFYDEYSFDTNNYNYQADRYSGLHRLKKEGGLYLAYAGGEKGKDSEQQSSTCAGWTSELTGGWNTLHGVDTNDDVKKADVDTIMLKYAKLGLNTGLAFDWGQLFDTTLSSEVDYLINNPNTPMRLRDIDRPIATSNADILKNEGLKKEKDIRAKSIAHYDAVAMTGEIHKYANYDVAMRDYLIDVINDGDDIVGGIFHRPDTNGHTTGFGNGNADYINSVRNADIYLYEILDVIEERQATLNEDWLVIVTADHGGSGQGHGEQVYEHRTIWLATNKPVSESYYGNEYNGYVEK